MIVFIDDSGDPGFNVEKGASSFFVLACVIFADELEAEKVAVTLKQLRRDLKFSDRVEFKFNKSSREVRETFLKALLPFSFTVRAIVVNKQYIKSKELIHSQDSFYNYFIKQVLKHDHGTLKSAKVRLDGHGNRSFRRNSLSYLRREVNTSSRRLITDVKLVDSGTNILIQVADMIAGSIRRAYENDKTDALIYKAIIKHKISNCWEFK